MTRFFVRRRHCSHALVAGGVWLASRSFGGGMISWLMRQPIRGEWTPSLRPLGTSRDHPQHQRDATCQSLRPASCGRSMQLCLSLCSACAASPRSAIGSCSFPRDQMPPLRCILSTPHHTTPHRGVAASLSPAMLRNVSGFAPRLSQSTAYAGTAHAQVQKEESLVRLDHQRWSTRRSTWVA
ncbi:hypothetical protein VTI28DRAFT_7243 [Corynascus sepedonium]